MKSIFNTLGLLSICFLTHAATFNVAATGTSFSPANLSIHTGDVVHWMFDGTHDVTSGTGCTADNKFSSGTKTSGQTYDFTFTAAGTFPYYCSFHCSAGMTGTITVTTLSGINTIGLSAQNLLKVYPNPVVKTTTVAYQLSGNARVSLILINAAGQRVLSTDNFQSAGSHEQVLDLGKYAKGIYILQMDLDGVPVKEEMLVKE